MDRLVALAVNRRFLMVGMFVAVLIGGLIAFNRLNIEAYPDPTPPMVDIVTQSPGLSAEALVICFPQKSPSARLLSKGQLQIQ